MFVLRRHGREARCVAPPDIAFGRNRPTPRDAFERESHIADAASLERRIQEKLLEDILLRMTAA
jgi:hypothetical protein